MVVDKVEVFEILVVLFRKKDLVGDKKALGIWVNAVFVDKVIDQRVSLSDPHVCADSCQWFDGICQHMWMVVRLVPIYNIFLAVKARLRVEIAKAFECIVCRRNAEDQGLAFLY